MLQKIKDKLKALFVQYKKKIILGVFVIVLILFLTSCCVVSTITLVQGIGSGKEISEKRNPQRFTEISLKINANVFIKQGETESIVIEAEDNIVEKISTEVTKDNLKIDYKQTFPYIVGPFNFPRKPINIYITVTDLKYIYNNSSGVIETEEITTNSLSVLSEGSGEMKLQIDTFNFDLTIDDSANIEVNGEVKYQKVNINGSGDFEGKDLIAEKSEIRINGSGNATINSTSNLDVNIQGSGNVYYLGVPSIKKEINGSGKLEMYK